MSMEERGCTSFH